MYELLPLYFYWPNIIADILNLADNYSHWLYESNKLDHGKDLKIFPTIA